METPLPPHVADAPHKRLVRYVQAQRLDGRDSRRGILHLVRAEQRQAQVVRDARHLDREVLAVEIVSARPDPHVAAHANEGSLINRTA